MPDKKNAAQNQDGMFQWRRDGRTWILVSANEEKIGEVQSMPHGYVPFALLPHAGAWGCFEYEPTGRSPSEAMAKVENFWREAARITKELGL